METLKSSAATFVKKKMTSKSKKDIKALIKALTELNFDKNFTKIRMLKLKYGLC